jgi:hypothetical protein
MLYLIDRHEVQTKEDLLNRVHEAFDFRDNQWMKMVGLDRQFASEAEIEQQLNELFSHGWVVDQDPLLISQIGREYLKKQNKHSRRHFSNI